MSYRLDDYSRAWAMLMHHHLVTVLDRTRPIDSLGAGRMEEFELLRKMVRFSQGDEVHEELVGAPECRLPDDGSFNVIDEDPIAYAFLREHLPGEVVEALDEACGADAEPQRWLEQLEEEHDDWHGDFVDLLGELATQLHALALVQLRDMLTASGYSVSDELELVMFEHDDEYELDPEEVDEFELELEAWSGQIEALAQLFFDTPEKQGWFRAVAVVEDE